MAKHSEETNPFVQPDVFKIRAIWKMETLVTSGTENAQSGSKTNTQQLRAYKFEKSPKVLLYTDNLFSFYPQLMSAAKDMIMYIAAYVQYDCDYIELNEEKYCTLMNVSRSTFYAAKKDLTNRIIVPRMKRKNTYWINPQYLYRGSRMDKYPNSVVMENDHPFNKVKASIVEEDQAPYGNNI